MHEGTSTRGAGNFFRRNLSRIACWIIILSVAYSNYYNQFWKYNGRIIAYDVISYYQYLPAVFVYHDISMKFMEDHQQDMSKKIWASPTETGWYMGRMTMGLSIMFSPFFLGAHVLAAPLGYPADGFSPPYKVALILASIVYLSIGLFVLRAFLRKYYADRVVAFSLLLIGLATNLYFYTVIEPTMTHAFSFCLFALFLLLMYRWIHRPTAGHAIFLGLVTGLIALVRPSNVIIVLLIPLWEVGNLGELKDRIALLLKSWGQVLLMVFFAFLVVFPQLLYWKFASGHWVAYTYNEEGFFFNNPQYIRGLFSYRKGWLVYTPVMVFALLGLIVLFNKNRKFFWPVLVFTLVNTYIVFSWWSWWYGGGFGQRALIESYTILAVPMSAFIAWMLEKRWYLVLPFALLSAWFIFLNIFQTRQYYYGAIHWEGMTKAAYWDSFLHLKPSEDLQYLIRYPDNKKAMQGIYEDIPGRARPEERVLGDTSGYHAFILEMEAKMRADTNWMKQLKAKAEKWGKPVDTVIRNDARWMWERKNNQDE